MWAIEFEKPAAHAFELNNPRCTVLTEDCNHILKLVMEASRCSFPTQSYPYKADVKFHVCGAYACVFTLFVLLLASGVCAAVRFSRLFIRKQKSRTVTSVVGFGIPVHYKEEEFCSKTSLKSSLNVMSFQAFLDPLQKVMWYLSVSGRED